MKLLKELLKYFSVLLILVTLMFPVAFYFINKQGYLTTASSRALYFSLALIIFIFGSALFHYATKKK